MYKELQVAGRVTLSGGENGAPLCRAQCFAAAIVPRGGLPHLLSVYGCGKSVSTGDARSLLMESRYAVTLIGNSLIGR